MIKLKIFFLLTCLIFANIICAQPLYTFNSLEVSGTQNDETKIFQYFFELIPGQKYSKDQINSEITAVKRRLLVSQYYMLVDVDYDLEGNSFDLYVDLTSGFPYIIRSEGFGLRNFNGEGQDLYIQYLGGVKLNYSKKAFITNKNYFDLEYGLSSSIEKKDIRFAKSFKSETNILGLRYGYRLGDWTIATKIGTEKTELKDIKYLYSINSETLNKENQSNEFIQLETEFNSLSDYFLPESGLNYKFTYKITNKEWQQGNLLARHYQKISLFVLATQFKTGFLLGKNIPIATYYYNDSLKDNGKKNIELTQQLRYKIGTYSQGILYGTMNGYCFYSLLNLTNNSIDSLLSNLQSIYGIGINLNMPLYSLSLDLKYQITNGENELFFSTTNLF